MGFLFIPIVLLVIASFGADHAFSHKLKWRWVFPLCAFISGLLITLNISSTPPTWDIAQGSIYGFIFVMLVLIRVRKHLKNKFF